MEAVGKTLYENDTYTVESTSRDVYTVTITRRITVMSSGRQRMTVSFRPDETTVAQILDEQGIVLGENDLVSSELTDLVQDGETITVSRVTYETRYADESIEWDYSWSLPAILQREHSRYSQRALTAKSGSNTARCTSTANGRGTKWSTRL